MKDNLTLLEAYKAMYFFLDSYYFRAGEPDDVGALLGGLELLRDENPVDPAAWSDWLSAIEKAIANKET